MNNQEYWNEVKDCTITLVSEVINNLVNYEDLPLDELTADLVADHINDNGLIGRG